MMTVFTFIENVSDIRQKLQDLRKQDLVQNFNQLITNERYVKAVDDMLGKMIEPILSVHQCQAFLRGTLLDTMIAIGWAPGGAGIEFNYQQRAAITNLAYLLSGEDGAASANARYAQHKKVASEATKGLKSYQDYLKACISGESKDPGATRLMDDEDDAAGVNRFEVFDRMEISKSSEESNAQNKESTLTLVDKHVEASDISLIGTAMQFYNKGIEGAALRYRDLEDDHILVPLSKEQKIIKKNLLESYESLLKSESPIKFEIDTEKVNKITLGSAMALKLYLESSEKVDRATGFFCLEPEIAIMIMNNLAKNTDKVNWTIGKTKIDCTSAFPEGGSIYAPESVGINVSEFKRKTVDGKIEDVPWSADMGRAVIQMHQFFYQLGMISPMGINVRLGRFCLYVKEDESGVVRKMYGDAHKIQNLIHDDLVVGTLVRFKQDGKEYKKHSKHSICAGPWRAVIPHITAIPPNYHSFTALSSFMFTMADLLDIYLVGRITSRNLLFSFSDRSAVRLDINATRNLRDLDGDWKIETRISGVGVIKFAPKYPKQ